MATFNLFTRLDLSAKYIASGSGVLNRPDIGVRAKDDKSDDARVFHPRINNGLIQDRASARDILRSRRGQAW